MTVDSRAPGSGTAGSRGQEWETVVGKLQAGDILMVHTKRGWLPRNIRKVANSYWNHTCLVLMPKHDLPIGGPLIVEAGFSGVEIHQIRKYSADPSAYDIGVMRPPAMSAERRARLVNDFIMANLDIPYDYSRIFGYMLLQIRHLVPKKAGLKLFRALTDPRYFVCTTFVHRAFHEHSVHPKAIVHMTADDQETSNLLKEEMVGPGDIAREPAFEWIYNKHY